ncbi:hypothetical protein C0J52_26896 [Blattella germanica]|nr:hypothetical protein C0J52_26896 [Blattella germanica]
MSEPGSLSFLALDALGKYIYGLCSRLTGVTEKDNVLKKKRCSSVPDIHKVKFICNQLHDMIKQIPPSLANDLTNKLLDNIDNWDFEIGRCKKGSIETDVYEEIIKAVIHPALTRIESEVDLLDCSEMFQESLLCSSVCANLIIKNIQHLHKLKTLHALHTNFNSCVPFINFPECLVEFSGRCNKKVLIQISHCCKNLKYLDVFGSKRVTDSCVSILLDINKLEKLNISETKITATGIKRFLLGCCKKYQNLKYIAFSSYTFRNYEIFQNFSELKVSVQLCQNVIDPFLNEFHKISLKNICGLQIRTTLINVNRILQVLGSQLEFLDVEINDFWIGLEDNILIFNVAEILQVGQYCTSLKCLHISFNSYLFPHFTNYQIQPLPGFKTVNCLGLEIKNIGSNSGITNFLHFLIFQCVSVKKITLEFDRTNFEASDFILHNLRMGGLKKVELICFQTFCAKCSLQKSTDYFNENNVEMLLVALKFNCPSLRVIGINPEFYKTTYRNSQTVRFVPTWCRCK